MKPFVAFKGTDDESRLFTEAWIETGTKTESPSGWDVASSRRRGLKPVVKTIVSAFGVASSRRRGLKQYFRWAGNPIPKSPLHGGVD